VASWQRIVDLTQPLGPQTPLWPGATPPAALVLSTVAVDGDYTRRVSVDEHTGTHLDAPAHFVRGGATVDALRAERMVCDAYVVDVRERCERDAGYVVTAADLERFEEEHGMLPAGCAVLINTGWDRYLNDSERYVAALRFPGLRSDAARLLVERAVAGIGIDTLGVDAGAASEFPVHHITLPAGLWHLEGLVALDQLPPTGATIMIGAVPFVDASGIPVRVLALAP
jgi:kynurenine formamidase